MDKQMYKPIHGQIYEKTDRWKNRQMDRQIDGQTNMMDRQIDRQTNRWTVK